MKAIRFLPLLIVMICLSITALATPEDELINPPNIVLLFADDAGYHDFGFQGSTEIRTPHLDKLADRSIRCTSAYTTAAVCGPSRAGLLTGRYQQRFGFHENNVPGAMSLRSGLRGDDMGVPLDQKMLPEYLRPLGYKSLVLGKWHQGGADRFHPLKRGFDEFYGFRGGARSYWPHKTPSRNHLNKLERGFEDYKEHQGYLTDVLADDACRFIHANKDQPFFIYLSFNAVHSPMHAKPEDMAKFSHLSGKRKILAAMALAMDRACGKVCDQLEKLGLTDNTIVIFTNDNGGPTFDNSSDNAPLSGTKATHREGGIRVPFLFCWPAKFKAGKTDDRPIMMFDLLPTCVAAAGGDASELKRLDGVNLLPYWTGEKQVRPHETLFWKWNIFSAVREGDWKMIRLPDRPAELYNLANDIGEIHNLAAENPQIVRRLHKKLFAWELEQDRPLWLLKPKYERMALDWYDTYVQQHSPADLRCEYLVDPLGIDAVKPRLSWRLGSDQRGEKQTAYHILVASSRDKLDKDVGDLWDSGKVASEQSLNVEYKGSGLKSRTQYVWKVMIWNQSDRSSAWSNPAAWRMGILSQDQWQGQWIQSDLTLFEYQKELKKIPDHNLETEEAMRKRAPGVRKMTAGVEEAPAVWMRKAFKSESGRLRRATLFISGLGLYEAYLNGRQINDHLLTVCPHDFSKTVPYHSHDVTRLVKEGENALGVILGNGYFNPVIPSLLREYAADFIDTPRLRCELLLEFENGSSRVVPSDLSWKFTTAGPIRFNSIRAGETYDARIELGDWSRAAYEDKGWAPVQSASAPAGHLQHRALPPVRVIKTIPAVSVKAHGNGYRFDIGVESTGWARLKIRGKSGQEIVIRYPGANSHTLGRYQSFEYICKGKGEEIYEPRFAFNGYRYVDVQGLEYTPEISDLVGCQVVSDLQRVGSFSCSDERINTLQDVNCRTIQNYVIGTPMDPVREKVNWTQDVQTNFETSAYNFDVRSIYDKWQGDFIDGILDSGYVPTVIPSCFDGPTINGPWWGGMVILNPWQLHNFCGDKEVLTQSYDVMKRHLLYLDAIAEDNIIEWGLGDWMDLASDGGGRPKGTTVPYTSTCAYMMYADILMKTARILGKEEETELFEKQREAIRESINQRFYSKETGVYDKGSQTAYILALKINIMPESERALVLENFKKQIVKDKNHLSTGFVGTPFLLTLLHEEGLGDLAWTIATQETYPSWYDMIFNKENSVFKENWQGGLVQMPSLAGPIGAWFYHSLGGIRPETPGFKEIVIHPYTETLDWVKCEYESPYGLISSRWHKKDGILTMDITVPANTSATVYVPGNNITEGQLRAAKAEGVKYLRTEKKKTVFNVESGKYEFRSVIRDRKEIR